MIRFAVVAPNGQILSCATRSDDILPAEMAEGAAIEASSEVTGDSHWYSWDAQQFVAYTDAARESLNKHPGAGFVWSPPTGQWLDSRELEEVRHALLNDLRAKREALLEGGFAWDGSSFDSDASISQPRILGAFTTAIAGGWPSGGQAWRLKDNTWRVLSATDVQGVWAAFQTHMAGLFAAFAAHEAAVLAETDIEVLRAYNVEAGWP